MMSRRPPGARSMNGPMNGATTANGAKLTNRYSNTLLRAASGLIEKNSEPASDDHHRHVAGRHQSVRAGQSLERQTAIGTRRGCGDGRAPATGHAGMVGPARTGRPGVLSPWTRSNL